MDRSEIDSLNQNAAVELAKMYFRQLRDTRKEAEQLRSMLNIRYSDVEITSGRRFVLIDSV